VYIGQLEGSDPRRVVDADSAAVSASLGHLLFVRQGVLFAQRFDPARMQVTGDPVSVSDHVGVEADPTARYTPVSDSATGLIAFRSGAGVSTRQFVWVDRAGTEEKVGTPDEAIPTNPSLSSDGRRVGLNRTVDGNVDLWVHELSRGVRTRLTSDPAGDAYPVWSPDGKRLVFTSNRTGVFDIALDGRLMAVRLTIAAGGEVVERARRCRCLRRTSAVRCRARCGKTIWLRPTANGSS
jgi:hypothetical protein